MIGFAAALSLLSRHLLRARSDSPSRAARSGLDAQRPGRGSTSAGHEALRFRRWLVTAQVALTLVLLVAAGLFVRTLQNLGRVDLGLKPDHVIGFSVAPELNGYTAERTARFGRELTERLAALPGVRSATSAEVPTLGGDTSGGNVTVEGATPGPDDDTHVQYNEVRPDYFATLGIPLLAGREIAWQDDARGPRVAVVNETMARKFFGEPQSAGRKDSASAAARRSRPTSRSSASCATARGPRSTEKIEPFVYRPWQQDPKLGQLTFYARSETDAASLITAIRKEVASLDPQLPIFDVKPLTVQISDSLLSRRLVMMLSAAFGGLAALLAALGIYGVLAFGVAQRRREIGVRIALGATPSAVRQLVLSEVGRFLVIGGLIGLPAAYALGRAVESILYGIKAADAPIFIAGAALLTAVSFAAAYPPAHRASRTDAMEALRSE